MAQTVRQMILDILLEGPATAKALSARVRIPEQDVCPHLAHLRKRLHHGPQRLVMEPACCRACGFVFQKRARLREPGCCPCCHHSFLEAPVCRIHASFDAGRSEMGWGERRYRCSRRLVFTQDIVEILKTPEPRVRLTGRAAGNMSRGHSTGACT